MKARHCMLLLAVFAGLSCTQRPLPLGEELRALSAHFGLPLAQLSLDEGPVWLEYTSEGPALVASPADADLVPFEAWPHALRSTAVLARDGHPVWALNRWGFLSVIRDSLGDLYLMGDRADPLASRYSVSSFFTLNGRPSLLLSRDFFYIDSEEPVPRTRVIAQGEAPEETEPAFMAALPAEDGWEFNSLARNCEGEFLARAVRHEEGTLSFVKALDLDHSGSEAPLAQWLAAQEPRTLVDAEGSLQRLLLAVSARLSPREILVCEVSGPLFTMAEPWAVSASPGAYDARLLAFEDMEPLKASVWVDGDRALLLRERGDWLLVGESGPDGNPTERFGWMPAMPEAFVWTNAALAAGPGAVVVASWEEQDEWMVGSAGICVLSLD